MSDLMKFVEVLSTTSYKDVKIGIPVKTIVANMDLTDQDKLEYVAGLIKAKVLIDTDEGERLDYRAYSQYLLSKIDEAYEGFKTDHPPLDLPTYLLLCWRSFYESLAIAEAGTITFADYEDDSKRQAAKENAIGALDVVDVFWDRLKSACLLNINVIEEQHLLEKNGGK